MKHPVYLSHCQHLAVFDVAGADARSFLQSQLTQDVANVRTDQAAIAGFCTAQGRLWASMLLTTNQSIDSISAIVRHDLLESFLKRLKMFVLRSKVTIERQASTQILGIELHCDDLAAFAELWGTTLSNTPWSSSTAALGRLVQLPAAQANLVRYLVILQQDQVAPFQALLGSALVLRPQANVWQALDIKNGLPWVEAATQDLFIAQTLNLDLIGGVSFTKGCYPGQEVVARAHYRGTVKRRMHLARLTGDHGQITAASDVFASDDPQSPVGRVINLATEDDGVTWILFEAPFKAIGSPLHVASANGPALLIEPLPYALADE